MIRKNCIVFFRAASLTSRSVITRAWPGASEGGKTIGPAETNTKGVLGLGLLGLGLGCHVLNTVCGAQQANITTLLWCEQERPRGVVYCGETVANRSSSLRCLTEGHSAQAP